MKLSSSFEEDGRQFPCPGERVTLRCEVNESVIIRLAFEPFINRSDPVTFFASDVIGSSGGTSHTDLFQANLTNVQRGSNESSTANFTVTLTTIMTHETANTVVECADLLTSNYVTKKTLTQSCKPKSCNF